MKEYAYQTYDTGGGGFINNSDCGHRKVIDKYAAEGWRYVGFLPTAFTGHGGISGVDLIFERERSDEK